MNASRTRVFLLVALFLLALGPGASAEDYEEPTSPDERKSEPPGRDDSSNTRPARAARPEKADKRKYMITDPSRVDAGVFHVGFGVGGNFYLEPQISSSTKLPTGEYFKDFGFQGGVFFDYDYSELPQNIPLALRGMVGYKNVHNGTHVFAFDGMVRWMFRFSEKADFGLGFGGSAAVWFRPENLDSTKGPISAEEIIFLPSLLIGAGFDFTPFMVDFKCLINKIGQDATRMGLELYFGFRL